MNTLLKAAQSLAGISISSLLICMVIGWLCVGTAWALPATMPYQGELPERDGIPVNGTVDLAFSLFREAKGGLPVWTEIHLGVVVKEGRFKVLLGKNNPLDRLPSGRVYYVGVQRGLDPSVPELGSRTLLFKPPARVQPEPAPAPAAVSAAAKKPAVAVAPAAKKAAEAVDVTVPAAGAAVAALAARLSAHMADASAHHRQGRGSGLNADLLDGKDSTAFADVTAIESHTLDKKNPHAVTAA
ncbi:MAG: hypothetical protein Q9M29_06280, partial [Mariprofundaceae bacterium]|nr:hypothetical protein [Mariprofundaceae bacterium]